MPRKRSAYLLVLALLLLVSLGCSLSDISLPFWPFQAGIRIINHPEPNLASEIKPFIDLGCARESSAAYVTCPVKTEPFASFGCSSIRSTNRLGALEPDLPIMQCVVSSTDRSLALPNIYNAGCLVNHFVRYIIFQDGQFKLVSNLEEFRKVYAPVESPDEALSYALATTGFKAYYNQKLENYRYKVDLIEDTHVDQTPEGFTVHLFDDRLCGCGPYATSAVQVKVSCSGEVSIEAKTVLYEDPRLDGLCVD